MSSNDAAKLGFPYPLHFQYLQFRFSRTGRRHSGNCRYSGNNLQSGRNGSPVLVRAIDLPSKLIR